MSAAGLEHTGAVDVCALDDLRPDRILEVWVGRLRAGATVHNGRVYVFQTRCPHRGGPLARGAIRASVSADRPGEMLLDQDHPVVSCPWHNFEFSLETGVARWNAELCIRVFPTEAVGGRVRTRKPGGSG